MTINGIKNWDKLETVSYAPGYRDVSLRLVLSTGEKCEVNLRAEDADCLLRELLQVKRNADYSDSLEKG